MLTCSCHNKGPARACLERHDSRTNRIRLAVSSFELTQRGHPLSPRRRARSVDRTTRTHRVTARLAGMMASDMVLPPRTHRSDIPMARCIFKPWPVQGYRECAARSPQPRPRWRVGGCGANAQRRKASAKAHKSHKSAASAVRPRILGFFSHQGIVP